MSELAQQCEEIRKRKYGLADFEPLFAYICELQSELAAIKRTREQEQAYDSACYELQKAKAEIAELRRPVVESEEVEKIRAERRLNRTYLRSTNEQYIDTLLTALDRSEREKALVGEAIAWALENDTVGCVTDTGPYIVTGSGEKPPAHLLPILLQYAGSKS